jgi:hypothetical protein
LLYDSCVFGKAGFIEIAAVSFVNDASDPDVDGECVNFVQSKKRDAIGHLISYAPETFEKIYGVERIHGF